MNDLQALAARIAEGQGAGRRLVAVAGAPGAGKSTLADRLHACLAPNIPTEVLPMDGFHYDDIVLKARGHRPRKGAPHTYDVDGFAVALARIAADDGREIAVPVFDRSLEIARAGARIIAAGTRLVIVEGNYLLFDDPAWAPLRRHFDLTIFAEVPEAVLTARLVARWTDMGLEGEVLRRKLEENDLVNMRLVLNQSIPADITFQNT